jgi:hypothetical protein
MKAFWRNWLALSKKIVYFQTDILLTIIYYIFVVPLGFIMKIYFKKILLGHGHNTKLKSYWSKRADVKHDISWAKEQ